ncbi:MAG: metal ABC transporter permease [Patescibacteria group bacterium]
MFLDIFQFDFMIRAMVVGAIIAVIAPIIGIFLVVRNYSQLADTLAHVSLVGIAIGVLTHSSPILFALGVTIISALGIEYLRSTHKIYGESVLAIFLSGSLGIATLIISAGRGFSVDLFGFLFGSLTTVTTADLIMAIGLGILVLILVGGFYRELFMISLDEELARVGGIRTRLFSTLLIVLSAVAVTLSMRIIGVLLIGSLIVIPVISAMQFRKGFLHTMLLAVLFSFVSVVLGIFLSYYADLASGGTIVLITLVLFLTSLFFNKK